MKTSSTVKLVVDFSVFLAVRLIVALLQTVSVRAGYQLADLLAQVAYRIDRRHRRIAYGNLSSAFPSWTAAECEKAVFEVYRHFARMIVEMVAVPRKMHISNWKTFAQTENVGGLVATLLRGDRPILIATAHFGNWEVTGFLLAALGVRSFAIARDLDNVFLDRFLRQFRQWSGQTVLSKNHDYDKIKQVLESRRVLISLGDQSAGPKGYFVPFFGRPASTHKALALLALEYDAYLPIGFGYRLNDNFSYQIGIIETIPVKELGDGFSVAAAINQAIEKLIRRAPFQYLWLHNRWKHAPPQRKAAARAA